MTPASEQFAGLEYYFFKSLKFMQFYFFFFFLLLALVNFQLCFIVGVTIMSSAVNEIGCFIIKLRGLNMAK